MRRPLLHTPVSCLLLVALTLATGENGWVYPIPNFGAAMSGYDPVWADPTVYPDPGLRGKIFNPIRRWSSNTKVFFYSFIKTAAKISDCKRFTSTYENFNQYFSAKQESTAFLNGSAVGQLEIGCGPQLQNGSNMEGEEENLKVLHFFRNVTAEIIQRRYECATHDIALSLSESPKFQKQFAEALIKLDSAALNPNSAESEQEFVRFVNTYGTHFMESARLGSKAFIEKRYPAKKLSESDALNRSRCVEASADFSLGWSMPTKSTASVESLFSHEVEKCSQVSSVDFNSEYGIPGEKVAFLGDLLPQRSLIDWSREVEKSPFPVSYSLQKISTLFLLPSFDTILMKEKPFYASINGKELHKFFENKLSNYCQLVFDRDDCNVTKTGCGYDSTCAQGTECLDTHIANPSHHCLRTTDYGGVVVAGGNKEDFSSNHTMMMSDSESIYFYDLPSLSSPIQGNTLTAIGTTLCSCGGRVYTNATSFVDQKTCYSFDTTSPSSSWIFFAFLPVSMSRHTAVNVGHSIWFVAWDILYSLSTAQKTIEAYSLPFTVSVGHCAVSNAVFSYVIGVGFNSDEIWVNTNPSDPLRWSKVVTMPTALEIHACLWFSSDVIITGGYDQLSSVYVFNTKTNTVEQTNPLNMGRHGHQMMVLDGLPAVVAGWGTNRALTSIETYDTKTKTWSFNARQLNTAREHFGLAQLNKIIE